MAEIHTVARMTDGRKIALLELDCKIILQGDLYRVVLPEGWQIEEVRGLLYVVDTENRPRAFFAPHPDDFTAGLLGVFNRAADYMVAEVHAQGLRGGSIHFAVTDPDGETRETRELPYTAEVGDYQKARAMALRQAWSLMTRFPWE